MPRTTKQPEPSLAEDLEVPPPHGKRKAECNVGVQVKARNEQDRVALNAALNNSRWHNAQLVAVLAKHGIEVSVSALRNHRKGACPCYRTEPTE